jgi:hypothetical protein
MSLAKQSAPQKSYLTGALTTADELSAGHGPGPINHFHEFWRR